MSDTTDRIKFGNWLPTRTATLGGLTPVGWAVLVFALVIMGMMFAAGQFVLGLLLVLAALVFELLFVIRFGGEATGLTIASRLAAALGGVSRINRGEARFNTGLFSNLPGDRLTALPGVLANLDEIDGEDGTGTPFTLLYQPVGKTLSAVFACNPDGTHLQTQAKIDVDVARYGGWIASLSADSAVAGATVVVDSALRSSGPLVEKIASDVDPDAPAVARRAIMEAAERLPGRYSEISTWATVSWSSESLAPGLEDAVAEVAARLPGHTGALRDAGGGAVVAATSDMLAKALRVAYSPDRSTEFAHDELAGWENPMRVTEAGPDFFDDSNKRVCLHDGVASVTVIVLQPPRQNITEDTMAHLFRPSEKFLRKRVTVFYRTVSLGKQVQVVDRLGKTASTVATSKARQSARDARATAHASKLDGEITDGAALVRFAMAVTVTFEPSDQAYRDAMVKLKDLLNSASLTYRFCDYDAGAAFHATLPLGMLPWNHESQVETMMGAVS